MKSWSNEAKAPSLAAMAKTSEPDLDAAYALETPDDNRALYRSWAETYDTEFVDASGFRLPGLVAQAYVAKGGGWPVLDVGCGTGAVAKALPAGAEVDGLDLSPDMLSVARRTGLYRSLTEANLLEPLPLATASYAGILSSGTFTHGHVGAEALDELTRVLAPGGWAAVSIRDTIFETMGFAETFAQLTKAGTITPPEHRPVRIYDTPEGLAPGHSEDIAFITTFRRL